jgi:hypothetical protein
MDNSQTAPQHQPGIDPQPKPRTGRVLLDVLGLRRAGASLEAIGLAGALLSRDETTLTDERFQTVYGLEKLKAHKLVRELIVAGFLEVRSGLYHVAQAHRDG